MDIFKLSRNFFDWSFENPELITPTHTALYFFALEHCNRMWWAKKFWFPTSIAMQALWIKSYNTYSKVFNDLVEWWFIILLEKSKNQFSANIIAISNNNKALDKALDKALIKHKWKQSESNWQSIDSINIQETNIQETINKEVINFSDEIKKTVDFWNYELWTSYKITTELLEIYKRVRKKEEKKTMENVLMNYINKCRTMDKKYHLSPFKFYKQPNWFITIKNSIC